MEIVMNDSVPLLSVCLITYNHASYISQAIEGVLMQKVDFAWELIIADDFSTDDTREIINDYYKKNPNFIRLIFQEKNVGADKNWLDAIAASKSKYIAYFEGDDYWVDPHKLKKQVDFLEEHKEYVACFTNAEILNEIENTSSTYVTYLLEGKVQLEEIIAKGGSVFPTASLMFKKDILQNDLFEYLLDGLSGDTSLIITIAMHGKVYFLDQKTTVYRIWPGGMYSRISNDPRLVSQWKMKRIRGYKKLRRIIGKERKRVVNSKISSESLYVILNSNRIGRYLYLLNLTISDLIVLAKEYVKIFIRLFVPNFRR